MKPEDQQDQFWGLDGSRCRDKQSAESSSTPANRSFPKTRLVPDGIHKESLIDSKINPADSAAADFPCAFSLSQRSLREDFERPLFKIARQLRPNVASLEQLKILLWKAVPCTLGSDFRVISLWRCEEIAKEVW